jgi:hypothetical protein
MTKIAYEILAVEVDKLYLKELPLEDISGINEHIEFIKNFIEACGWSTDEYIQRIWEGPSRTN